MAGLYLHIPFCKSRCVYCGFYSTTAETEKQRYVDALCQEMTLRREYLQEPLETVYLGGGTPSQLTSDQLYQLFTAISTHFSPRPADLQEVTVEVNPDDVTEEFAATLSQLPVSRVSMGVQTFDNSRLRFLRRRHTAEQVPLAVSRLRAAGIRNISIDLMYGFPDETPEQWLQDIRTAVTLDVEHLSAYSLMYEEDTPLYRLMEQGKVSPLDEETERQMFYDLKDQLDAAGYEHYEISNFARKSPTHSWRSRHNSSYWHDSPYLGLGAAAHSYDRHSRQWNVSDITAYMEAIESGRLLFEREELDENSHYNDTVLTALRTCEGITLTTLPDHLRSYLLDAARTYISTGLLRLSGEHLMLTRQGLFVSDMVMADLMKV